MLLPSTQALHSSTFRIPPLQDGSLTVPELYDWHLDNTPSHPLFVYEDAPNTLKTIYWPEAVRSIHRASRYVSSVVPHGSDGCHRVMAVLASSDTVSYFCLMVGVLRAGFAVFPISPRNSPSAIAALLSQTNSEVLLLSPEKAIQDLASASLDALTNLNPSQTRTIRRCPMPTFDQLFPAEEDSSSFERMPSVQLSLDAPAIILHSSGTTTFPKPITWTHRGLLQLAKCPWYGQLDFAGLVMGCHSMPMFHGMGMLQINLVASSGIVMSVFKPSSPATIPNPVNVFEGTMSTKSDLVSVVPTFIEMWSKNPKYVEYMANMKGILYGGGPLNKEVGDCLTAQGTRIYATYGCTECGVMNTFLPNNPGVDWEYFSFSPHCDPRFVPDGHGAAEVILVSSPTHRPQVINTRYEGTEAYATSDLLLPHPTKPSLWKIYGRADDQIMLSTGEKTNPGPLENILNQDPHIQSAVMFGRGRFQNGVIVDPKKDFVFDPIDSAKLTSFRNVIWPSIERLNAFAPSHSRVFKEMVLVSTPSKPFTYTAKGTVRRQAVLRDYEPEISALYDAVEQTAQVDLGVPDRWDLPTLLAFTRNVVSHVVKRNVLDTDDLFLYGCDSLQAVWIRNSMLRAIRAVDAAKAFLVPSNVIYEYPTILSLASFLVDLVTDNPVVSHDGPVIETKADKLRALVSKYSSDFPEARKADQQSDHVLLTGTTGGFGANILARLVESPAVARVYALNRRSTNGHTLRQRQLSALEKNGLDVDILRSPKLELVECDLSSRDLAIASTVLEKLRSTVTHIIHNAWRVDFNLSVSSFEPDIQGVKNLATLAIESKLLSPPRFVFVSSIGVFRDPTFSGHAPEQAIEDPNVAISTGYSEAKWVAEHILMAAARTTPLRPIIVRPGQLTGGSNGSWNEHEWFPALVKTGTILQCLPDVDGNISWLPSHIAAAALVEMRNAATEFLHLVHPNPTTWSFVISEIARSLGVPLVSYKQWLAALEASLTDSDVKSMAQNPALRLLDFYRGAATSDSSKEPLGVVKLATDCAIRASSTLGDPTLPQIGKEDVKRWLSYWRQRGFIPTDAAERMDIDAITPTVQSNEGAGTVLPCKRDREDEGDGA